MRNPNAQAMKHAMKRAAPASAGCISCLVRNEVIARLAVPASTAVSITDGTNPKRNPPEGPMRDSVEPPPENTGRPVQDGARGGATPTQGERGGHEHEGLQGDRHGRAGDRDLARHRRAAQQQRHDERRGEGADERPEIDTGDAMHKFVHKYSFRLCA